MQKEKLYLQLHYLAIRFSVFRSDLINLVKSSFIHFAIDMEIRAHLENELYVHNPNKGDIARVESTNTQHRPTERMRIMMMMMMGMTMAVF